MVDRMRRWVTPTTVWWAGFVAGLVVLVRTTRHQWYLRDDWAFTIVRPRLHEIGGWDDWLLTPQDGHLMVAPLVVWRAIQELFGLDSYVPFALALVASHLVIVFLVRRLCQVLGVSEWTATLSSLLMLVFGSGWENMVFGVQTTFNFSLAAFLGQLLLVHHDGPVDRRDVIGSVVALVGATSSGFGPVFVAGIALYLVLRRRWVAAAVGVVPSAVAVGLWWLTWGADPVAEYVGRPFGAMPRFGATLWTTVLQGMAGTGWLAGAAGIAVLGVVVMRGVPWSDRSLMLTCLATVSMMFVAVTLERAGIGLFMAKSSRYAYMSAAMLLPLLGRAVDELFAMRRSLGRLAVALLAVAVVRNARILVNAGDGWAALGAEQRRILELVAGYPRLAEIDPWRVPVPDAEEVRIGDIPGLVADGALTPQAPSSPEDDALLASALGLGG